jgi:hypothetical protein
MRGDPMQPLLWTSRSLRNLLKELAKQGHKVCPTVLAISCATWTLASLQANSKTREGSKHIDRDAQFQYINALMRRPRPSCPRMILSFLTANS